MNYNTKATESLSEYLGTTDYLSSLSSNKYVYYHLIDILRLRINEVFLTVGSKYYPVYQGIMANSRIHSLLDELKEIGSAPDENIDLLVRIYLAYPEFLRYATKFWYMKLKYGSGLSTEEIQVYLRVTGKESVEARLDYVKSLVINEDVQVSTLSTPEDIAYTTMLSYNSKMKVLNYLVSSNEITSQQFLTSIFHLSRLSNER